MTVLRRMCSGCRYREPMLGYRTCTVCHARDQAKSRRSGNPPGRKPGAPQEYDQQALPKEPNLERPGMWHSCAVCGDYDRCHLTQLELGGPAFYVCTACNTEEIVCRDEPRRSLRDDDESDMNLGDMRAMVSKAYERIVPKNQRGLWLVPFGRGTDE